MPATVSRASRSPAPPSRFVYALRSVEQDIEVAEVAVTERVGRPKSALNRLAERDSVLLASRNRRSISGCPCAPYQCRAHRGTTQSRTAGETHLLAAANGNPASSTAPARRCCARRDRRLGRLTEPRLAAPRRGLSSAQAMPAAPCRNPSAADRNQRSSTQRHLLWLLLVQEALAAEHRHLEQVVARADSVQDLERRDFPADPPTTSSALSGATSSGTWTASAFASRISESSSQRTARCASV